MRIDQEHWYYTTNELWQFHSFDDEPAIVVESYTWISMSWEEEQIEWYKARYKDGNLHRENWPAVIRDSGEEFYYIDGEIVWV